LRLTKNFKLALSKVLCNYLQLIILNVRIMPPFREGNLCIHSIDYYLKILGTFGNRIEANNLAEEEVEIWRIRRERIYKKFVLLRPTRFPFFSVSDSFLKMGEMKDSAGWSFHALSFHLHQPHLLILILTLIGSLKGNDQVPFWYFYWYEMDG